MATRSALLAREGIAATRIRGYDHEEFIHMATAATVRAGKADVAFGIEAAARVHDLAFATVVTEHYYFACRREQSARPALETMIATAASTAFARALRQIGGYETRMSGKWVSPVITCSQTIPIRGWCTHPRENESP